MWTILVSLAGAGSRYPIRLYGAGTATAQDGTPIHLPPLSRHGSLALGTANIPRTGNYATDNSGAQYFYGIARFLGSSTNTNADYTVLRWALSTEEGEAMWTVGSPPTSISPFGGGAQIWGGMVSACAPLGGGAGLYAVVPQFTNTVDPLFSVVVAWDGSSPTASSASADANQWPHGTADVVSPTAINTLQRENPTPITPRIARYYTSGVTTIKAIFAYAGGYWLLSAGAWVDAASARSARVCALWHTTGNPADPAAWTELYPLMSPYNLAGSPSGWNAFFGDDNGDALWWPTLGGDGRMYWARGYNLDFVSYGFVPPDPTCLWSLDSSHVIRSVFRLDAAPLVGYRTMGSVAALGTDTYFVTMEKATAAAGTLTVRWWRVDAGGASATSVATLTRSTIDWQAQQVSSLLGRDGALWLSMASLATDPAPLEVIRWAPGDPAPTVLNLGTVPSSSGPIDRRIF